MFIYNMLISLLPFQMVLRAIRPKDPDQYPGKRVPLLSMGGWNTDPVVWNTDHEAYRSQSLISKLRPRSTTSGLCPPPIKPHGTARDPFWNSLSWQWYACARTMTRRIVNPSAVVLMYTNVL